MHLPDGVLRTPLRSVTKCTWFQVRFENRLQHQLGRSLYHPVPYGRYPERPLAASGLRDHHPSHRTQRVPRLIRLMAQFLPDAGQPLPQTPQFDFREALSIHPWRSLVGARPFVGMAQNVFPVNLVVEHVEAVSRLVLRLAIQLDLKFPDLARCCQTHRQSPSLPSFTSTPLTRIAFPTCRAHYPGGPDQVPVGCRIARSRARFFPIGSAFPRLWSGRHPHLHFRGLLKLHTRYGLRGCSPTIRGLYREAPP